MVAIPKPKRIVDPKAIDEARKIQWCEVCGSRQYLEVHHIKTRGSGGDDVPDNLIRLCWICHRKAHDGNLSKFFLKERARRREYGKD